MMYHLIIRRCFVALRKESVDRNRITRGGSGVGSVALRKESVDRNPLNYLANGGPIVVALRKESVDRNSCWLLARI